MIRQRRSYYLVLLILWLAFGLRLYRLERQSIWWDEGHSIFVANHPLPKIPTLPAMDVHPPAYFALLHGWMAWLGRSEFILRYLSVIFSLLTVALLWRFSRALSPSTRSTALVAVLLAALSPLYVAYAQEVRSYAMITFLTLGSAFALWQIMTTLRQAKQSLSWLIVYVLFTAACLYTHYFTIFLLLFQNLIWLGWLAHDRFLTKNPHFNQHLKGWFAAQAVTLILFLPQFWLALRQVTTYTNPNLSPPDLVYFISRTWQAYTVGLTIDPTPARWGMWILVAILIVAWGIYWVRGQLSALSYQLFFLLAWLLIPLTAYFIVLQRQPSFEPRYMMLITPALFLLFAFSISDLAIRNNFALPYSGRSQNLRYPREAYGPKKWIRFRLPPSAFCLTLLTLTLTPFIIGLHSYFTNQTYFKDDSAGVARWLATETTANDIVYVDVPHPFHYYAKQSGIPAPTRYLFVDVHTAAETLNQEAAGRERLYWVTWRGSDTDPREVVPFLAEKTGRRFDQRDFRGYQVTWFELPDRAAFSLPSQLNPVEVTFGDVLRLDGVAYGQTTSRDNPTWATLHFTLLRPTEVNYKVSVRLRGDQGQLVSQADRDLLNDRHFRTAAWPLHDPALNQAINVYTLPLTAETAPGTYRLETVIYNAEPPYPSEGVTGVESSDGVSALLGHITVTP